MIEIWTIEKGCIECDYVTNEIKMLTCHRIDYPAYIRYDDNDDIVCEGYFFNGKLHRTNGAAIIWYKVRQCDRETYYLMGVKYTRAEWCNEVLKYKLSFT